MRKRTLPTNNCANEIAKSNIFRMELLSTKNEPADRPVLSLSAFAATGSLSCSSSSSSSSSSSHSSSVDVDGCSDGFLKCLLVYLVDRCKQVVNTPLLVDSHGRLDGGGDGGVGDVQRKREQEQEKSETTTKKRRWGEGGRGGGGGGGDGRAGLTHQLIRLPVNLFVYSCCLHM